MSSRRERRNARRDEREDESTRASTNFVSETAGIIYDHLYGDMPIINTPLGPITGGHIKDGVQYVAEKIKDYRNRSSRVGTNDASTMVDTTRGTTADIRREPIGDSPLRVRNNRLDQGTGVGTEAAPLRRSPLFNNNLNSPNNNINNTMTTPFGGVTTLGGGSGDPKTNPHALGNQNASDTFDVGYIKAAKQFQPADCGIFKMIYPSHAAGISLDFMTKAESLTNYRNVFQPDKWDGNGGSMSQGITPENLKQFIHIRLNTALDPVAKNGANTNQVWRNTTKSNWPNGFNKYKTRYRFYKVLKTHIKIKFQHIGDSNNPYTGMPVKLMGYRNNTHMKLMMPPTTTYGLKESPFGFDICDWMYPKFASSDEATLLTTSNLQTMRCMDGKTEHIYEYTYGPDDVTTTVDLDGDTNNKSLWSAVDAAPPELQDLFIYAIPMFTAKNSVPLSNTDYKDAAQRYDIEIYHTIQFRDPKYDVDWETPDTNNTT